MSNVVWFKVPLSCLTTGTIVPRPELYTSNLSPEPGGMEIEIGDVVEMTLEDFQDAYYELHPVEAHESTVRALERWGCESCHEDHWVRIEYERVDDNHFKLSVVQTVPLTTGTLDESHFVSRWMNWWLEARPDPRFDPLLRIMLPVFSVADRKKLQSRLER